MSEWLRFRENCARQACQEIHALDVVKHLSLEQQSAVENLTRNLVLYEKTSKDPEYSAEAPHYLNIAFLDLKRILELQTPREVILAILDREAFKPQPVAGRTSGGGG